MKTMKKTSALRKLEALTLKSNENPLLKRSKAYELAMKVIEGRIRIYPIYYLGSGKYTSIHNHWDKTTSILNKIGIEYIEGKDRGVSSIHKYIEVTTKIK